jgi:hypothetical protein
MLARKLRQEEKVRYKNQGEEKCAALLLKSLNEYLLISLKLGGYRGDLITLGST